MKNYKLITHFTPVELNKLVEEALVEGWQLVGGISVSGVETLPGKHQMVFFQAVAK